VRAAICSGQLVPGDILPSMPDLARLQGLKPGTVRHALIALAKDGLVEIRQGTTATITGEPGPVDKPGNTASRLGHSGGGATTLKHYADPVSEVDRRAAVRLAQLTLGSAGRRSQ
jgi:DNA-binding transcriptional MocR family regulator